MHFGQCTVVGKAEEKGRRKSTLEGKVKAYAKTIIMLLVFQLSCSYFNPYAFMFRLHSRTTS